MSTDAFYQKIIALTTAVESLLEQENESDCANLLAQRQVLLVELKQVVDGIILNDPAQASFTEQKFQQFLISIQTRDKHYLSLIKEKSQKLLGQSSQQAKGKKAIKAYRSSI
ncbi:MAG: hypothetical protein ACSHW0_09920 [Thalassotalea sp.]